MNGVTQTYLAGRADGIPGNCIQAAVATICEVPLETVPHFLLFQDWTSALHLWLDGVGLTLVGYRTDQIPDERCIVAGTSPRGIKHVVVGEAGQVAWDPHPSRDGLTTVDEVWFFRPAADGLGEAS